MTGRIIRQILRRGSLALVLIVFAWALLPPETEPAGPAPSGTSPSPPAEEVKYVLKISPGPQYTPGAMPFDVGEPLEGLGLVIRAFEKRFPDTRIEIVNTPVIREYLVTQLSSGAAPDIVCVNVEDVWVDVQKGWYVPLDPFLESPNEFIREKGDASAPGYEHWWDMFKYQAISRGKAGPDGLSYCLSYDMVETGLFYNKDIFRKAGVEVPKDWDEFIAVLAKIKAAGYTPVLMNSDSFSDWCTDLLFDQLYDCILPGIDLYKDPVREPYLQGYLDDNEIYFLFQQGFFTQRDPRYREVWRIMREYRQYCNQTLVNVDLIRDFVTQKAAILWNSSVVTYRLTADPDLGFEWGVFYVPQFTANTSPYACGHPMCVIGGAAAQFEVTNSAVSDTPAGLPIAERARQSRRLERVIQLLQFMCVPENYEQIVNEYDCFLPNIVGVPVRPSLQPFAEILERRYTTTKWVFTFDLKFNEIQRRILELYLNDGLTLDEFMDWQTSNIAASTANLALRKPLNLDQLERAWDELAPARAAMKDLPDAG